MTAMARVSILIQPEGRMQPRKVFDEAGHTLFQSSSSQKAGCNTSHYVNVSITTPHVSILIQPEGRMQPRQPLFPTTTLV